MTADQTDSLEADPSSPFFSCWEHLDEATRRREAFAAAWGHFLNLKLYDAGVTTEPDGTGTISVWADWPDEIVGGLRGIVTGLVAELRGALDEAVRATVRFMTGQDDTPETAALRFPICVRSDEFQDQVNRHFLDGLRPDQVRLVRSMQPILDDGSVPSGLQLMRDSLQFLRDLEAAESSLRVLTWRHSADPQVHVEPPASVVHVLVEPDGFVELQPVVARFRLHGYQPAGPGHTAVQGNPNTALDAVVNVGSVPAEPDDTLSRRTYRLLLTVSEVVRSFERSVGLRHDMPPPPRPSTDPRLAMAAPPAPWNSLEASQSTWTPEEIAQLRQSPLRLAAVVGSEDPTLLVVTPAGVFERRVPPAIPLPGGVPQGKAAELVTASVAAGWGLPDFVFRPVQLSVGSGRKEPGDGIVIVGGWGLMLQVKTREAEPGSEERERSWLNKKMHEASRQAAGAVRQLRRQPVELLNGRGRSVLVDGTTVDWTGVVIIDHPEVPEDVVGPTRSLGLPVVVLLRRDWEFLFDQLRSVHAVTQYLRRVADLDESVALGTEPLRYYELAQADEEVPPSPVDPALLGGKGTPISVPHLPKHPAGSDDQAAHGLYRIILEDIATSAMGDGLQEQQRLQILAQLDGFDVVSRSALGQHLIKMLEEVVDTPANELAWRQRRVVLGKGQQLCFGVCSRFDEHVRLLFSCWVQLRHHDLQQASRQVDDSITVAVLLTPRPDGRRRWDTSLVAVHGNLELSDEQLAAWRPLWPSP